MKAIAKNRVSFAAISALILVFHGHATAQEKEKDVSTKGLTSSKAIELIMAEYSPYAVCIGDAARKFSSSGEPAETIARAAQIECSLLAQELQQKTESLARELNQQLAKNERIPIDLLRESFFEMTTERSMDWAITEVVRARSQAANEKK